MKNQVIYIALGAILVCAIGYLLLEQQRLKSEIELSRLQLTRTISSGRRGEAKDPYISEQVKNRIIKGGAALKECYKAFLKTDPERRDGKLKFDWTIDVQGKVHSPQVVFSTLTREPLATCLKKTITAWRFPKPYAEKYVSHTFRFRDVKNDANKKKTGAQPKK